MTIKNESAAAERMKNGVWLTALLAMLALSSCAASHASSSFSGADNGGIVSDVQEFDVGGVHVLMRQSTAAPVVSAILFIKGGEVAAPPEDPLSLEYFTLKIAAASGNQLLGKEYFERKMVRMGTSISGDAGNDFSAISMECIRENFDTSWAYFTNVMLHPAFDSVEFQNFKRSVLIGLSARDNDAEVYSNFEADSMYFAGHPYGRIMTAPDVNRESIPLMQQRFQALMVKSRFLLSVVGNISREELTKKIEASIASLPEGSYTPAPVGPPVQAFSPSAHLLAFNRKLPTDYIVGYYHVPSEGDSDYYPYLRLRNFFGGFVFNHIRVQHNLAYAPNVDDRDGKTSIGIITLQTSYVDSAIKLIYEDVDFFQQNLIRESAIREGVAGWATRNYLNAETTADQAVKLGQAVLTTGDWRNAFFDYDKLASVTPQALQAAAEKYLRNFNWVIVGDTVGIDRAMLDSR
ncbi:MAG TPA: insulinase family protein [Candidatus Kapabacteria bacterium]|nr:insulinase family protein [Candidatus Kapabacteria bacterium]